MELLCVTTHTITIYPTQKGLCDVVLSVNGETLMRNARTPFLSAARALLRSGVAKPCDRLEMRREGQPVSLSGPIGSAAKLTVLETAEEGPCFAPYRHRPLWAEHE